MINNAHHRRSNQHLKKQGSKFTEEFKQLLEEVSEHEAFYRKQVEQFQAMMAKNALKGSSRNDAPDLHNLNSPKANQQINRELQLYSLQQKYDALKEEFSQQQIYYTQLLQLIASKDQWMSEQERKMANTLKSLQSPPTSPNRQPDFDSPDQQQSTISRLKEKCEELTEQNLSLKSQLDQSGKKKSIIQQCTSNSPSLMKSQKEMQIYQQQIMELNEQLRTQKDLNSILNQTCEQLSEKINQDHSDQQQLLLDTEGVYKEQIKLLQEEIKFYKQDSGLKTIYEQIGTYLSEFQLDSKISNNDEVIRKLEFSDTEHDYCQKQELYLYIQQEIEYLHFNQSIAIKDGQMESLRCQYLVLSQELETLKEQIAAQQQNQISKGDYDNTSNDQNEITNFKQGSYEYLYIQEEIEKLELTQINIEKDKLNTLKSSFTNSTPLQKSLTITNFNTSQEFSRIQDMLDYEIQIAFLQSQLQRFKAPSINNSDCGNMTAESNQTIETVGQKIQEPTSETVGQNIQEPVDNLGINDQNPEEGCLRHSQQIMNLSHHSEQIFKADSSKSDQVVKSPQERQKLLKNIMRTAIYSSEILNSKKDFTTLNCLAKDLTNSDSKQ